MGCELSQAFARLGSEVHLVSRSSSILPREEPEASRVVHDRLTRDGVICHLGVRLKHGIDRGLVVEKDGLEMAICGEAILVATGRRANVDGLNLLAAEVQCDSNGVIVDDYLRTTNRRIFAAGDVCSKHRFTHAADAMARCVIKNALFLGRSRWSSIIIPHSTYTDPELASVGMNESEAAEKGIAIRTLRVDFRDVDRAVIDDDTDGFAQVHVRSGTDKIIGATIVGATAGELIAEVTLAMAERIGMRKLATVVRPYPTRSLVFSKLADAYQRTRLTPTSARILRWFLRQRR
jgi:pyruvate/2-oxoglutarate dehydrogenase complex dihydrolipoamide dehydrogenase (E3) component